ncbi:MAG: hypothetical protein A2X94_16200 [Bdellovibrionales bacterium GWB1_55_8]|nr:MAG: hypothetical protein A2X94_16200 [Bdellovibrionales bacterium GWB1_55_8]
MALLNRKILISVALATVISGCGEMTITETLPLETDTYISSSDPGNHASLDHLRVSKSATDEERIILKLPTQKDGPDKGVDDILADAFVKLFFMPLYIMAELLDCSNDVVTPENLTSAKLVLDVQDDANGGLDDKLSLSTLAGPWWQSVNWTRAHPFSAVRGTWATPGGDVDPAFTPVLSDIDGTTVTFDVTDYFQDLISANGTMPHYGFLMKSSNATLNSVTLRSTQSTSYSYRPRLVSTYTGTCNSNFPSTYRSTVILGDKRVSFSERVE